MGNASNDPAKTIAATTARPCGATMNVKIVRVRGECI
jgi:hypothetical protein